MQNTPRVENLLGKKCQKIPNLLPPNGDHDWDSSQTAVTAYLNQAFYTIRAGGRAGEFPVGETNRSQTATDVVMVIT